MLAPVLAIALFALALEAGYRGYLYASFPDRFEPPPIGTVQANDASMWRFNARVGYEYVPSQTITTTTVVAGKVSGCGQTAPVNAEGNIGPTVPDYDTAELKVALFGDSFSASSLDGMTWPALLQDRLESITGNRTRVLNLARDGYGVLQMFELAAAKIREVRPHLVIFAFIHPCDVSPDRVSASICCIWCTRNPGVPGSRGALPTTENDDVCDMDWVGVLFRLFVSSHHHPDCRGPFARLAVDRANCGLHRTHGDPRFSDRLLHRSAMLTPAAAIRRGAESRDLNSSYALRRNPSRTRTTIASTAALAAASFSGSRERTTRLQLGPLSSTNG
jgi:hypothetical protein